MQNVEAAIAFAVDEHSLEDKQADYLGAYLSLAPRVWEISCAITTWFHPFFRLSA